MRWLQCVHLCHVHLTPTSEFGLPAMKLTEITSAVNRVLHKTQFSCEFLLQLIIRILYLSVTLLWNLCFVIMHQIISHRRKLTQSCRLLIFLSVYKEELCTLLLNTIRSQINKGKLSCFIFMVIVDPLYPTKAYKQIGVFHWYNLLLDRSYDQTTLI